jgi:hypothetical protein
MGAFFSLQDSYSLIICGLVGDWGKAAQSQLENAL